jgi:acetyl esterase/lipase
MEAGLPMLLDRRDELRFSITEQPGLLFAEHDGEALHADAYLPDGEGPFPAFVLLHGGAFTKGDRASYAEWGRFLAAQGYVALSADYRLATAGRATFPEAVLDARAAVQFLRASATDLRVDPSRIGVLGGSAGGYLAAMVGLTAEEPAFANPYPDPFRDVSAAVSVVVVMAGLVDLIKTWIHDRTLRPPGDAPIEAFLGGTPLTSRRRYFEASPLFHASEANARGTRWLIAWGTNDEVVPPDDHALALAGQLQLAGALVRLAPIVGAPHFWYMEAGPDDAGSASAHLAGRLLGFLRTWCGW